MKGDIMNHTTSNQTYNIVSIVLVKCLQCGHVNHFKVASYDKLGIFCPISCQMCDHELIAKGNAEVIRKLYDIKERKAK